MNASLFSSKGGWGTEPAPGAFSAACLWAAGALGPRAEVIAGPSAVWWETHSDKFFWKRLGQGELGDQRKGNTGEMVERYAVWPPWFWEANECGILWMSVILMVFRESTPWPVDVMLVESLVHLMMGCIFMVLMFLCWAMTLASVEMSTSSQPDASHLLGSRVRTLLVPWTVPLNGCVQREVNSSHQLLILSQ